MTEFFLRRVVEKSLSRCSFFSVATQEKDTKWADHFVSCLLHNLIKIIAKIFA